MVRCQRSAGGRSGLSKGRQIRPEGRVAIFLRPRGRFVDGASSQERARKIQYQKGIKNLPPFSHKKKTLMVNWARNRNKGKVLSKEERERLGWKTM